MSRLETERVTENYQVRPGEMGSRQFWIAYPPHVGAYGHMEDRISRSWGRGDTEAEALANARTDPSEPMYTVSTEATAGALQAVAADVLHRVVGVSQAGLGNEATLGRGEALTLAAELRRRGYSVLCSES